MRGLLSLMLAIPLAVGCGDDGEKLDCGEGTHEEDGTCVADEPDSDGDWGETTGGSTGAGACTRRDGSGDRSSPVGKNHEEIHGDKANWGGPANRKGRVSKCGIIWCMIDRPPLVGLVRSKEPAAIKLVDLLLAKAPTQLAHPAIAAAAMPAAMARMTSRGAPRLGRLLLTPVAALRPPCEASTPNALAPAALRLLPLRAQKSWPLLLFKVLAAESSPLPLLSPPRAPGQAHSPPEQPLALLPSLLDAALTLRAADSASW